MKKNHYVLLLAALSFTVVGCSSDDDDDAAATTDGAATAGATTDGATTDGATTDGAATDGATTDGAATDGATTDGATTAGESVTYTISVTNNTAGQPMTAPVAAIHDDAANLFEVGQPAIDGIRDIAESGNRDALLAFAVENAAVISASAVIGADPILPGAEVNTNLSTTDATHVLSLVNMIICTNDGITGVDSVALPTDNEPLTIQAKAYDAGTRVNQADNNSFIPPPCGPADAKVDAPVEDPRMPIAAHPGQTGIGVPEGTAAGAWDFAADADVMTVVITRN